MNKVFIEKVSIIIPVYNSSKTISLLVDKIQDDIKIYNELEIVLVNDGSRLDNSSEVCENIAATNPTVKFINLSRNFGEHNAVLAGLNYCTGDCAVIMDDDFQNPPKDVYKLVDEIINGNDVVFSKYEEKKHHFLRNLGSKFNNLFASILLNKPRDLYLSSFKAINRFVIDELVKYKGPYPYIDGLILRITQKFVSVSVEHVSRANDKSGYSLRKLISLWLNMFTNFSIMPLRLAVALGFIFSIVGLVLALVFFIEKINNPELPMGWTSLMVSIFLLGSLQLFAIGMVGEYLGRMFLSTGGKPQFVVRSLINCSKAKESEK
jgi:undecaprenyl-phosphate 4-deoxy-4-formamido-L-arabinose transferase|tara:strand:+ start:2062 stop:3024 length:963 start_codon:yes stop_codon:yes gene_type:complete